MNEAQTLVHVMCNVNQTFRTEENFVNPWQKSWTDCDRKNHEQQTLNEGLKKHGERREDAVLKIA